jgi:hypothetical protein
VVAGAGFTLRKPLLLLCLGDTSDAHVGGISAAHLYLGFDPLCPEKLERV